MANMLIIYTIQLAEIERDFGITEGHGMEWKYDDSIIWWGKLGDCTIITHKQTHTHTLTPHAPFSQELQQCVFYGATLPPAERCSVTTSLPAAAWEEIMDLDHNLIYKKNHTWVDCIF